MKTGRIALAAIFCGLFFFVSSPAVFPSSSQEDFAVSPSTGIKELDSLLYWAEQVYLIPNKLALKDVNPQKPHHLENLAAILGAVLQSQTKYRGPEFDQSYERLELAVMAYLASRTTVLENSEEWGRIWSDFAMKGLSGKLNEDFKKRYHVDPAHTNIPSLLSPSPGKDSPLILMDEVFSPASDTGESAVYGHGDMETNPNDLEFRDDSKKPR
jgi:hypothetical protein